MGLLKDSSSVKRFNKETQLERGFNWVGFNANEIYKVKASKLLFFKYR